MSGARRFRPGKRDLLFLAVVAGVLILLALGTSERKTKPVPDDETHRRVTAHATCMECHGPGSARPQPPGHTREVQCFLCHAQPEGWVGAAR